MRRLLVFLVMLASTVVIGPPAQAAELAGFTHGYVRVDDTDIHYVKGGSGPAILLLHGWPPSSASGGLSQGHHGTAHP